MQTFKILLILALSLFIAPFTHAADATSEDRERQIRERYEKVLLRNPFQDRAFTQVYESYLKYEGIDAWLKKLEAVPEGEEMLGALLLQGQILDRQFKPKEAIAAFEKAGEKGEKRAAFKMLLGTLYYKIADDEKAAKLLGEALDDLADLDQRSSVCRMLGNLYLRQGKRDEAIKVWKRIAEQNPKEIFSQLELAEIYEDNRMWDEAIAVYRNIADLSKEDPYRRCRALKSIGQCLVQAEKHKEAIATFEEALGLVAPGNWLFEDIKHRLVGVYEDIGDLEGLTKYLIAKLEQNPADMEFRDLLAETYTRMAKFDLAEKEYRAMLERNPRSSSIQEKLISLYQRTENKPQVVATYEKLIELFPSDSEYLRRLGEFYLRDNKPDKAKETWQRLVKDKETPEKLAELAGWYEEHEFPDEAASHYEKAITVKKSKDWIFRLAALKFQKGDETNAIQLWTSSIDPAAAKAEDFSEVAGILEAHQKFAEAGPLRKQATEKGPDAMEHRLALAKNLMVRKSFEEALAEYEYLANQSTNEYFTLQGETGRLDAFRELGVLEEKQKEWEQQLAANPNSVQLLSKLARLYERAGQREKAIQLYERRRAAEPDNIEFTRSLAGVYKAAKQMDPAIELLKGLAEKDKNRARIYHKELLDIYLGMDLREEAVAAAEKIVTLAPSDPEARLDLAQVYSLYQNPEKALQEYRYTLRLEPKEPDYYRQYGDALSVQKKWGEAQEAFRKMLDVAKENSTRLSAVQNLARIYMQQDRLEELTSEFNRRVRNTPKKLAAYEELAAILKEAGQLNKAVETLESGLQLVDDKQDALKGLIRTTYEAQDFQKVRTYFEQMLALSGKPTAFEYERLGSIYAQMGEVEKAKETWVKIVEINSKDPKLVSQYSDILKREGFTDEAIAAKGRAIELDPFNYKQRYDYAQLLASSEQHVRALEELRKLLEIGDIEEKKKEASTEKKVERLNRGQNRGPVNAYQFMYGVRSMGQYFGGGGWQGSYKEFRPQVVMFMASLAQQSIGEDNFIKEMEASIAKNKDNTDLKRDLVAVYQMYNRVEEALKLTEEIIQIAPNDVDLIQRLALYYSSQQQPEKAIPLLAKLAETQPKHRMQAVQGLIPLYMANKQPEKAMELVDSVIKENPNDIQLVFSMGSILQNQGKFEKAREIYKLAEKIDPNYRSTVIRMLGQLYKQEGKHKESLEMWKEVLLAEDSRMYAYMPANRQVAIYSPNLNQARGPRFGMGPLGNLPQNLIGNIDYSKVQAMNELKQANQKDAGQTNAWAEFVKTASNFSKTAAQADRARVWNAAKMLIANYITNREYDEAEKLLKSAGANGMQEVEWFNLSLYLAEQREQFPAMMQLYSDLEKKYPGRTRDISVAKASAAVMAKNYDETAKIIRQMNQERVPPAQIVAMIQPLIQAGEKKTARKLLEEHIETSSRNSQALQMLAGLYAEENDYDRAIAFANEAWQRKAHGRSNNNWMYGGNYVVYGMGIVNMPGGPGNLLRDLHRYYVSAGKSEQLINEFKQRLEKQPGSIQAYENLAELYRFNNDRDKALEVYESLAQKRPHLQQTKKTIANLHTEKGDFKKATEVYEKLLQDYPTAYQQLSWELRNLYQRIGKGKELEKMEDKMASKARDPGQIQQMAQQFMESGDLDKAADLYQKAMKMSPQDTWMKNQLADIYVQQGKVDEAVKLYREYLDSPQIRAQGFVDSYSLMKIAGLFHAAGKLQELKDRCESELKKNPTDANSKCLQAQIYIFEKNFPAALAYYEEVIKSGRDGNALYHLMQLAEITGDVAKILEIIDRGDNSQNRWNLQRVATFFQAQGNEEKAKEYMRKWADEQLQNRGGGWEFSQTLRSIVDSQFWDLAEEVAAKHRNAPMDTYYRQEFDRVVVQGYISNGKFTNVINPVLEKENLGGRDLDLVKEIAKQYQQKNDPVRRKELLEKVAANDKKNRELAFELAEMYGSFKEQQKREEVLAKLVAEDPNNQTYRQKHTDALIELGRGSEALKNLEKWVEEKPLDQRLVMLSDTQKKLGLLAEARQSLKRAQEVADPTRKLDYAIRLAQFEAEQGDIAKVKEAIHNKFKTQKDGNSFSEYLNHLKNSGYDGEAHQFFVAEKEGFLDRYRRTDFFDLCYGRNDLATMMELNWRFLRYGERWDRDYYFRPVREFFQNNGKIGLLLDDVKNRIAAEQKSNPQLLRQLGQSYQETGFIDEAMEVYRKLLESNPYDHETLMAQAGLLGKIKRAEEAVALLRNRRPATDLQGEVAQKIQLIRVCFENKQPEAAEKEIESLLSWARGGSALSQVADLYLEQKMYEKALKLYLESERLYRSYNRDNQMANMGKCYAKLKQTEKLQTIVQYLAGRENTYGLENLANWCVQEAEYESALKLFQGKLEKQPGDINTWFRLAQIQKRLANDNEAFAVIQHGVATIPAGSTNEFLRRAGQFIREEKLIEPALERCSKGADVAMIHATLHAFASSPGDNDKVRDWSTKIEKLSTSDPEVTLLVGEAFHRINEKERSVAWLSRVMNFGNEEQKIRAAKTLNKLGDSSPELLSFFKTILAMKPYLLISDLSLVETFASIRDEAFQAQLADVVEKQSASEDQKKFYSALIAHYKNKSGESLNALAELGASGKLSAAQLQQVDSVLKAASKAGERMPVLKRIAAGGYGYGQKYDALGELVSLYSSANQFDEAIQSYAEMFPQWGMAKSARALKNLVDAVNEKNLAQVRKSIIENVRKHPGRDANSQLLGIYVELAAKHGQSETLSALCTEAQLDGLEKAEAESWATLVQNWELSSPFSYEKQTDVFAPEVEYLKGESSKDSWKKLDPKDVLGIVYVQDVLGKKPEELSQKVVYARTEITSPDDRDVIFTLGADDWVKVWVNGEEVHSSLRNRSIALDQERFRVSLKKGKNTVLVKVGNSTDSWAFCLRVAEGNTGLVAARN